MIGPEKERNGIARGVIAVDDAMRRRPEAVVRVARQHRPGVDDEGAGHRGRAQPLPLGRAHLETRQRRLREERQEIVVRMRREAKLVVLRARMRRVMDQPDRAIRLGEGGGEIVRRQVQRHRDDWHQPGRSGRDVFGRPGAVRARPLHCFDCQR